jgi:hypothetical protein
VRSLETKDGVTVRAGEPLADLSADQNHVWEALRALVLVGTKDDLEDVQRFTRPTSDMSQKVLRQAQETVKAIETR